MSITLKTIDEVVEGILKRIEVLENSQKVYKEALLQFTHDKINEALSPHYLYDKIRMHIENYLEERIKERALDKILSGMKVSFSKGKKKGD